MTQYSSREPFNDDPMPFLSGVGNRHATNLNPALWTCAPRPEFDRAQTNPTNPILAKLRSLKSPHRANWIQGFMERSEHVRFPNWNDNEVDHARRVLARLANLNRGRDAAE